MKRSNFDVIVVLLAVAAMLGMVVAGCAPAKPVAPAVPAPAAATPPTPPTPSAPPAAQQAVPPSGGTLPTVNYFSSTADSIPPNAMIILVWSVTGADSVSIDNGIGKVDAQGRLALMPAASTTYTLTAMNPAGSVTGQVAVQISALLASSAHYRPGYKIDHIAQTAVVGSPLTIKLDTQSSDDSQWVVDYYDPTMFSYVSSNFIKQNPLTRGVDGQQQFTFNPLDAGDAKILVSYVNEQTPTKFDSIIYDIRIHR